MKQLTLAATGFDRYAKTTRRATFLAEMERVVPWSALCGLIEPFYPKAGNGRPPVGVERMLRIYFLQQWFNLSDPAVEEALYDSAAMRSFVGIDLGRGPCAISSALISAASRCPTKRRYAAFAICSSSTIWDGSCSTRCSGIWRPRD
jgi:IS5 family transposase